MFINTVDQALAQFMVCLFSPNSTHHLDQTMLSFGQTGQQLRSADLYPFCLIR